MSIIESRCKEIEVMPYLKELSTDIGAETYIVGGTVRDIILEKDIVDIDITVFNIDYIEFAKELAKRLNAYHTQFKDNVAIMSRSGKHLFDISKPRGDNIYEDLLLRDFTINNLAIDMDFNLIGDDTDIRNGLIRKAYRNSLTDDPIRILRVFRFIATLDFELDDETLSEAIARSELIKTVAYERILNEIVKLLNGEFFDKSIQIMLTNNILQNILDYNPIKTNAIPYIKTNKADIGDFILPFTLSSMIDDKKIADILSPLKLSNKSIKDIALFREAKDLTATIKTDDDVMHFVYNFYHHFDIIMHFLNANMLIDTQVEDKLNHYHNIIIIENETMISGDILQSKYNLTPSPKFKAILYRIRFDLVYGKVNGSELDRFVREIIDEVC